jgi:hypothetical protein
MLRRLRLYLAFGTEHTGCLARHILEFANFALDAGGVSSVVLVSPYYARNTHPLAVIGRNLADGAVVACGLANTVRASSG